MALHLAGRKSTVLKSLQGQNWPTPSTNLRLLYHIYGLHNFPAYS
jgi:hypothetical protein